MGKSRHRGPRSAGDPRTVEVVPCSAGEEGSWAEWCRIMQEEARVRLELPRLLAAVVDAGEPLRAAELVRQWGRGERSPAQIRQELLHAGDRP